MISPTQHGEAILRIRVRPALDPRWAGHFDGLTLEAGSDEGRAISILEGALPDQAALRGLLSRLWDLNLQVLSVEWLAK